MPDVWRGWSNGSGNNDRMETNLEYKVIIHLNNNSMNTIKRLFVARWWNPLFWVRFVVVPVVLIIGFTLSGMLTGFLIGMCRGSEQVEKMSKQIQAQL